MREHRDEARGRWLMCVEAILAEEMMKGENGFLWVPLLLLQERRRRVHDTMSKFCSALSISLFFVYGRMRLRGMVGNFLKTHPQVLVFFFFFFFFFFFRFFCFVFVVIEDKRWAEGYCPGNPKTRS